MLKPWRDVVVVGVINCADEINSPICREHAIDSFPTLKVFLLIINLSLVVSNKF